MRFDKVYNGGSFKDLLQQYHNERKERDPEYVQPEHSEDESTKSEEN